MKGGVILFRGTGAAACRYLESDRSRADDYYLEGGTALAAFTVTDGCGEVLATSELDSQVYASWVDWICLLYTSPSPRDKRQYRMPSSA